MKIIYKNTFGDGTVQYVEYEIAEEVPEASAYSTEQLESMTNAELQAILAEMGVSASMTKANMVRLIMGMQEDKA